MQSACCTNLMRLNFENKHTVVGCVYGIGSKVSKCQHPLLYLLF